MAIKTLITDLDGTLIPLAGNVQNRTDLEELRRLFNAQELKLIYATGRHPASVVGAIEDFRLPFPDWVICDVGTTVLYRSETGRLETAEAYHETLQVQVSGFGIPRVCDVLTDVRELRLQEQEKQGQFKLSFYTDVSRLDAVVAKMDDILAAAGAPWWIIRSVDPFTGDGLIDVLPGGVSKASAIAWWADGQRCSREQIVYAGDSGNDLAALTAGYRSITVQNTPDDVVSAVRTAHADAGRPEHHHHAAAPATSGVLEGLMRFFT